MLGRLYKRASMRERYVTWEARGPSSDGKTQKGLVGLRKSTRNLQGLANDLYGRNMQKLAERICDFFQSVAAEFTPLADEFNPPGCNIAVPDRYVISVTDVEKELMKVRTDKAVGPDRIRNWVLRDCAYFLSDPVCAVFNSSLRSGYLQKLWRNSDIAPLPKITPASTDTERPEAYLFKNGVV